MEDEVRMLLAATIQAAETHGWVRGFLMVSKDARWISSDSTRLYYIGDRNTSKGIDCDEVASCCTLGYIKFAEVCLAPLTERRTRPVVESLLHKRICEVLWKRDDVRAAAEKWWQRWQDEHNFDPSAAALTFEEWLDKYGWDEIGGEGLVPFWNDEVAQSRDDVLALLREVEREGGVQ